MQNFRLKRKAVSSDQVDPGLNAGWAYFVEERQYKSYLNDHLTEWQEVSIASKTYLNLKNDVTPRAVQ